MFAAIGFSSSKSGVIACLASLFFVAMLAGGRQLPRRQRVAFVSALAVVFLAVFIFVLPTSAMVYKRGPPKDTLKVPRPTSWLVTHAWL